MLLQKSVGIVVPTRNCRELLPDHLANLRCFRDEIAEIVFVDSESTDGTLELVKAQLKDWPQARLLQTPPGLYASWNAAIAEIKSKWVNIATVGDMLRPSGLVSLAECGEKLQADAVLSPPIMVNSRQESVPVRWPIHELIDYYGSRWSECLMDNREKWLFLTCLLPSTILGSAASNLYRTSFLQKNPFPTYFGHEGDVAWGIEIAHFVRLAIVSKECASFVVHERDSALSAGSQSERFSQLSLLARKALGNKDSVDAKDAIIISSYRVKQMEPLWNWLCSIELSQEERLRYIGILENERDRLIGEIYHLKRLKIFPFFERPNRGDIVKILRPLKRRYDNLFG